MDYNQYKGKPFQVISKLQVRYTGIFQDIDQDTQTLCLSEVFNHGTEDRPSPRALPGSPVSLGWVRFHTNSIESLALVENYAPPQNDDQPADPILASVSKSAPGHRAESRAAPTGNGIASLPPKPVASASSANAAMDRVQKSLSELSVDSGRRRKAQAPAVPDAEFDFAKGNEEFQKQRQARKDTTETAEEVEDIGEPENKPHPSLVAAEEEETETEPSKPARKPAAYSKSSFFDNISADSSRVSRADERHRNYDTFGEAGGADNGGARGFGNRGSSHGQRGGGGRGRGRRGGFNSNPAS